MKGNMKAVVLYDTGKTCLRDVPVPVIGDGDILIEVKAAGICGGDLHFYDGSMPGLGEYPMIMGHEFSGVIAKRGKNVDSFWQCGDRVVSENTGYACGRCPACQTGNFVSCEHRETLGCSMDGGFTNYVRIPEQILRLYPSCLFRIPENLSFAEATVLEPASNAYKALIQEGKIMPGDNLVVFGAGALGLLTVQLGKIAGASKIILVGLSQDKATRFELGKAYGATHCLASNETDDIVAKVKEIAGPDGVAVAVDAAGAPACLHLATQMVRSIGKVIRIGMNDSPYGYGMNDVNVKSLTIRGHMGYNTVSWRNCISLAAAGILDLHTIISHQMPLSDFDKGFELTIKQEATKVILIPSEETEV